MSKRNDDTEGELRFSIGTVPEMTDLKPKATVTIRSRRLLLVESIIHHFRSAAPEFAVVGFEDAADVIDGPVVCILETGELRVDPARRRRMVGEIARNLPGGRILVLSGCRQEADAIGWLTAGADGYCSTQSSLDLLVAAVHVLAAGGIFLPTDLAQSLLKLPRQSHERD